MRTLLRALLGALVVLVLLPGSPAVAAGATVTVTSTGLSPDPVTVASGGSVTFVNHAGVLMTVHSDGWSGSALVSLSTSHAFTGAGSHPYTVSTGSAPLHGTVTVTAPAPSSTKAPAPGGAAGQKPAPAGPAPVVAPPPSSKATPANRGGSGYIGGLSAGGFNSAGLAPPAGPGQPTDVPPPQVAGAAPGQAPVVLPDGTVVPASSQIVASRIGLVGAPSTRELGLPAVLGSVLLAGLFAGLRRVRRAGATRA